MIASMMNPEPTVAQRIAELGLTDIRTRAELRADGLSGHAIAVQMRTGGLTRIRRGIYATGRVHPEVAAALRIGGRLTCIALLRLIGVFVLETPGLHVHVAPDLSRSRRRRAQEAILHWGACTDEGLRHVVSIVDAVRQSVRCQAPRAAIATLDSVLHHGVLSPAQIVEVFRLLPARFQSLLPLVDGSAESGPETFMRLLLRVIGAPFETQVLIDGVGRVDFVVDGWLIIECDSREFHQGWEHQVEDRRRDMAAAQAGYVTIRPLAGDIFVRPDQVRLAVQAVLATLGPLLGTPSMPQLRRSERRAAAVAAGVG